MYANIYSLSETRRPIAVNIMNNAEKMLKSRNLGGYTKESVERAIEYSSKNAVEYSDKIKQFASVPVTAESREFAESSALSMAKDALKTRLFGGYRKDSALDAIRRSVVTPLLEAEHAISVLGRKVNDNLGSTLDKTV